MVLKKLHLFTIYYNTAPFKIQQFMLSDHQDGQKVQRTKFVDAVLKH